MIGEGSKDGAKGGNNPLRRGEKKKKENWLGKLGKKMMKPLPAFGRERPSGKARARL